MTIRAEYGSWQSVIDAQAVAGASVKFGDVVCDEGIDSPGNRPRLYWIESRPNEAGRNTIMALNAAGESEECLPAPWSARSAVHEYGGGAFTAYAGELWFVNAADQAIYHRDNDGVFTRLTHPGPSFADLQYDAGSGCIIAVCEQAATEQSAESLASLVRIDRDGAIKTLAEGRDFYASPRLSPDARELVWLCWDHPNMPWDGCELWSLEFDDHTRPGAARQLAGGADEALFQPQFSPGGLLHIVSDACGWWNIYRVGKQGLDPVTREPAEFGLPQWVFGQSSYAFTPMGELYALFTRDGLWQFAAVDGQTGALKVFDLPFTHMQQLRCAGDTLVFIGASATRAPSLCRVDPAGGQLQVLRQSSNTQWQARFLSAPEAMEYATGGGDTAHALYYPPVNPEFEGPADARPPLMIKCHGGPTGATSTSLDLRIQFWTSRGFAVLDVNYRGSTGYGRDYRQKLYGQWGIADVEDCKHGARALAERDLIDATRVVISGSSAGGYTVLCVLCFTDIAAAGASYYGIADLQRLLASTHKFESRYLGRLIGDDPNLLRERSPLYHADKLNCPVLFLQGLKDKVVPPDQATAMVEVLRDRDVPVAYISFAEERHGFKTAENIVTALESELAFYARVLGFEPAGDLPALDMDNESRS